MQSRSKASAQIHDNPSEITDRYWLFADRKAGTYPLHTDNSGKWLIFMPAVEIDDVWAKIKLATEEGRLGDSAKVATAKPNVHAGNPDERVICVYTYDWTDEEDVRRIRQVLRELGITWKISYKTDADTRAGRYTNRGHARISKYLE